MTTPSGICQTGKTEPALCPAAVTRLQFCGGVRHTQNGGREPKGTNAAAFMEVCFGDQIAFR